jgi:hypothetical protein
LACPERGWAFNKESVMIEAEQTRTTHIPTTGGGKRYRVAIRRDINMDVKPEAEQIDGNIYLFKKGWVMDEDDKYPEEEALIPTDANWPADAPGWIASGDLEIVGE